MVKDQEEYESKDKTQSLNQDQAIISTKHEALQSHMKKKHGIMQNINMIKSNAMHSDHENLEQTNSQIDTQENKLEDAQNVSINTRDVWRIKYFARRNAETLRILDHYLNNKDTILKDAGKATSIGFILKLTHDSAQLRRTNIIKDNEILDSIIIQNLGSITTVINNSIDDINIDQQQYIECIPHL